MALTAEASGGVTPGSSVATVHEAVERKLVLKINKKRNRLIIQWPRLSSISAANSPVAPRKGRMIGLRLPTAVAAIPPRNVPVAPMPVVRPTIADAQASVYPRTFCKNWGR